MSQATLSPVESSQHHALARSGCRFCGSRDRHSVVDLGMAPLSENFLSADQLNQMEPFYPLHAVVCAKCFLVQVDAYVSGEHIFGQGDYAYFSSYSDSWLRHAARYVDMITQRLGLDENSQVIELASNDGYLLQNFVRKGIPCLGIEPAANCAAAAREKGVPSLQKFFGAQTARQLAADGIQADLMIAINVAAHVPDLNDFIGGMKIALKPEGIINVEFPHLMRLFDGNQFDTIYQEHYCYYSLHTLLQVFAAHGLQIFDVEELPTHGGSLRIYVRHADDEAKPVTTAVTDLHQLELDKGYASLEIYRQFARQVHETKWKLLEFLIGAKREGKRVACYGAPGKGNTLLNYCGVREDFIDFAVDRNPFKHHKFLCGTHIPVFPVEKLSEARPDYILILPWNLKDEIAQQLDYTRQWGAQLVVPIPELAVF